MPRRNGPDGWVLPTIIHPPKTRCFVIQVPDEREYIAAFRGALMELASGYNWQDDPDHLAREVALVWRGLIEQVDGCADPQPQLGVEFDGEELMGSLCEALRFQNGVLQAYCCGEWVDISGAQGAIQQGASQPPAGGSIPLGECQVISVVLNGRDKFLIPFAVDDGTQITIDSAQGGWWNGDALQAWQCPSGDTYALGVCVSAGTTDPANPVPSLPYGRLIAQVGNAYLDADNTTITVPSGTGPVDVYLQMNDSDLTDNQGSISFNVTVCNETPSTWTSTYDFALGPLGWSAKTCVTPGFPCSDPCNDGEVAGTWDGLEWHFVQPVCSNDVILSIQSVEFDEAYIRSVTIYTDNSGAISSGDGQSGLILSYEDAGGFHIGSLHSLPGGVQTNGLLLEVGGVTRIIVSANDYTGSQTSNITKVVIEGTGPKPPQLL